MENNELNIPSTVKDPHYRYKMPRIQTALQGSGNGIKTKWVNLPDVSNALKLPVEYPLKFIGRELGSNTELKANSYLINGNHPVEKMQELLDKFIKKYVLCPKCHLPEIHGKIKVTKKDIKCTCRSCGTVSKLDNAHDFATYIRRNPPPYEEEDNAEGEKVMQEKEKEKKSEKEKKGKKEKKFDKELKKNIKDCCLKLPKIIKDEDSIEKNIEEIKKYLEKYSFDLDINFYCFSFGIIPKEIYTKSFEHRLPIIKHFIEKESNNNPEEALFYFLIGLQDYIFSRQKGENKQYISSLLYYLYDRDILTEEFWLNYLSGKIQEKYQTILNSAECEQKLKEAAKDFSNWIENGPYEGEDEEKKEKNEEKEKEKENEKEKEKDKNEEEKESKKEKKKGKKKKDKKNKKESNEVKEDKKKEEKKEDKAEEKEEEKKEEKKEEDEIDIDGI